MRTFRCLLVLPMLLPSVAMRPSLELESQHQAVSWKWSDPCAKHEAKQTSKWWHSKTVCECTGGFLTSSSCSTPLKKSFDPKDEPNGCSCEEVPCKRFGAESEDDLCRCMDGLVASSFCSEPGEQEFPVWGNREGCECWDDPCSGFDAYLPAKEGKLCRCLYEFVAGSACSRPGHRNFPVEGNSAGCKCVFGQVWAESVRNPVRASALAFCEAVIKADSESFGTSQVPSVEMCQALVAGLPHSSKGLSSEFKGVEQLSKHPDAHSLGRLDPLVDTKPTAVWHLQQVCKDECEELVNTMGEELGTIKNNLYGRETASIPPFMGCVERVVKKVEAEMLGCCGRSCGWNGHTCMAWPFIEESDKVDWLEECCTENNGRSLDDSAKRMLQLKVQAEACAMRKLEA